MIRAMVVLAAAVLTSCGPGDSKPAGTSADPVEVCERVGDVCRIDDARLGVCVQEAPGKGFACQSQH